MPRARADLERLVAPLGGEPADRARGGVPGRGLARGRPPRRRGGGRDRVAAAPDGSVAVVGRSPGPDAPRRSCSTRTTTWSRRGSQASGTRRRGSSRSAPGGGTAGVLRTARATSSRRCWRCRRCARSAAGGRSRSRSSARGRRSSPAAAWRRWPGRVPTSSAATRSCSPTPATSRWASPRSPPRCAGPGACWSPCAPWTARPTPGCTAGPRRTRCRLCSRPWRACATRPARRRSTGWPTTAGGPARHTARFADDVGVLDGVQPLSGDGASIADLVWARPAATVLPSTASRSPR